MGAYAGPEIVEDGLVLALDAGNKKSYSQNEHPNSLDIYGWYVGIRGNATANNCTISRDTISSPVGNTPLKMNVTGNDPHIVSYNSAIWNIAPALNGETWIVSVYVKADVATTGQILIFGANSSGVGYVNGAWLSLTATTVNIGTEWTRVQHVHTMNNADVAYIHIRFDGPESGGTGQTVWWDGLQVERVPSGTTTPTPFTSAYYGGSVYKDLFGSNNGTLVNYPTYNSSNGGSLSFDGVDEYVQFPSTTISRNGGAFSIWFYVDDFTNFAAGKTVNSRILVRGDDTYQKMIALYNGGYGYENNTNSNPGELAGRTTPPYSSSAITSGQWINFVMSNGNSQSTFYINGVFDRTLNVSDDLQLRYIGYGAFDRTNYPDYLKGKVSNFKIYNRALTASEIQQNYIATKSRFGL